MGGALIGFAVASLLPGATMGGVLMAAALGGLAGAVMNQPEAGGDIVNKVGGVADKTLPQRADQLDAAELGDEESEKRKRQSAKSKFKIDREEDITPAEVGVKAPKDRTKQNKVTGVQI